MIVKSSAKRHEYESIIANGNEIVSKNEKIIHDEISI